jgi:molecular chaperone GrpE
MDEETTAAPGNGTEETGAADGGDAVDPQRPLQEARDTQGLSREELVADLQKAGAEIERLQDQTLRRQAELANYRRRVQKEQADLAVVAQARLLAGLAPVIDDFERAVETESTDARAYHEGMEAILRGVHKVLEQIGVERLEPRGEPFDPRYHEAIARHETDEVPPGQVLEVLQPGYRLEGRLVRPATVVVSYAAGSADGESPPAEEPENVAVVDHNDRDDNA